MDETLWLAGLRLPLRLRQRWMRGWNEGHEVPVAVRRALESIDDEEGHRRWIAALRHECGRHSIRTVTAIDPTFPRVLLQLSDPPLALFLRGDLSLLRPCTRVGVVGARRGTARGRRTAERMGAELARAGLPVVSGLALGVDGAAHVGCLAANGRPIGVLGTGADRVHPPSHRDLHGRVARTGILVSEHPPGTPAHPHHFPARNRILAALSTVLVVVEAGERSGALSTVDFANQMGLDVFVVPGPVDCPHAVGTLSLLREGAVPVRHASDLLESMGREVTRSPTTGPLGLGSVPESSVEIASRLGWTLPRVLAALGEAELLGQVERAGADRWMATVASSGLRPAGGED